jgi:hypothetical protein
VLVRGAGASTSWVLVDQWTPCIFSSRLVCAGAAQLRQHSVYVDMHTYARTGRGRAASWDCMHDVCNLGTIWQLAAHRLTICDVHSLVHDITLNSTLDPARMLLHLDCCCWLPLPAPQE